MANDLINESDIPKNATDIDVAPIVPGVRNSLEPVSPMPPKTPPQLGNYFSGTLPSDLQHDGIFVRTGYQTTSAIRTPLMPTPLVANPGNTAGIQSVVKEFISTGSSSTVITAGGNLNYRGTWNNFTNYQSDDVVLYSGFLYLAVSASMNQTPNSSPAFWQLFSGTGSVTSVAMTVPAFMAIGGSPIVGSGTFVLTFNNQSANFALMGPTSGAAAAPGFRAFVVADIPNLPASIITSGQLALARGGTNADLSATGGTHQVLKQISSGAAVTVGQLSVSDLTSYTAVNLTAQVANVAATTALAVTNAGLYQVTVYIVISQVATVSSAMPDTQIVYTDQDSGATITVNATATSAGNALTTFAQAVFVVNAKASTNIQYAIGQLNAYASVGATPMKFAYRLRLEYLG